MHTYKTDSLRIHHDGDFEGPFYLADESGMGIVCTLETLTQAAFSSEDERISITGPNEDLYDRHDITEIVKGKTQIKPGDWETVTLELDRTELLKVLYFAVQRTMEYQMDEIDKCNANMLTAIPKLSRALDILHEINDSNSEISDLMRDLSR